jgi:hypothetical protein
MHYLVTDEFKPVRKGSFTLCDELSMIDRKDRSNEDGKTPGQHSGGLLS